MIISSFASIICNIGRAAEYVVYLCAFAVIQGVEDLHGYNLKQRKIYFIIRTIWQEFTKVCRILDLLKKIILQSKTMKVFAKTMEV